MENKSIFWKKATLPRYAPLREDAAAQVLVIGGGIAGILTARLLLDAGVDVLLLEANRLCGGQTGGTTAKLTVAHGFCYADIVKRYGREGGKLYYAANQEALTRYRKMAQGVECNLEERDFYAYAQVDTGALERELSAVADLQIKAELALPQTLPFDVVGAVRYAAQAQLDPIAFLGGQLAGMRIFEETPVVDITPTGAVTASGHTVQAERIVIATHYPFLRFRGGYPFKMYQSRSYVMVLEGAPLPGGMWADGMKKGVALRDFEGKLLISGGAHRTGCSGGGYFALERDVHRYYPEARILQRFAAQDCMTLDGLPYIGRYTKHSDKLLVATGFCKWGMTTAMAAAMILADIILGKRTPYAALFAPSRQMPPLRLCRETGAVLWHYLRPTAPRCPHLGCALRWNRQERSWDCPCHGSRFSEDGKVLNEPAAKGLRKE